MFMNSTLEPVRRNGKVGVAGLIGGAAIGAVAMAVKKSGEGEEEAS